MTTLRFLSTLAIATLISTASSDALAQVGRGSGLWKWTPLADHHSAIVEISSGGGSGTGVLISIDEDKPVKDGFAFIGGCGGQFGPETVCAAFHL